MGWQDQYQSGSFRGAPFLTQRHEFEFGRRSETNEFAYRDEPWNEDLGRMARSIRVTAIVIGDDYFAARDALIAALETKGPGTLVHPWFGTMEAQPGPCRMTESTAEGGMASFDITFLEPGSDVAAEAADDTSAESEEAADAADQAAEDRFPDEFQTDGVSAAVQAKSGDFLSSVADTISTLANGLGGAGAILQAFLEALGLFDEPSTYFATPGVIASGMVTMVGALGQLGDQPQRQIAALRSISASAAATVLPIASASTSTTTTGSTGSSSSVGTAKLSETARLAANMQATIDLVIAASAAAVVRAVAGFSFSSSNDAADLRDQLSADLDDAADAAHDRGNFALAEDLDTLRRALVKDLQARGSSLQPLFTFTPVAVRPALSIAWSLYRETANVFDQADDLNGRNAIEHPLFVPAAPLLMLAGGTSNG